MQTGHGLFHSPAIQHILRNFIDREYVWIDYCGYTLGRRKAKSVRNSYRYWECEM